MDVNHQKYILKTKIFLVFFCFVQFFNCKHNNSISDVNLVYENEKAIEVRFTSNLDKDHIKIYLKGITDIAVLGEVSKKDGIFSFTPIVPFSNGETYEIRYNGELQETFAINKSMDIRKPELLAIYPTRDTVPENLLKMYFVFSKPMQEVNSALEYITVIDETKKEEVSVFLELQTELWNKDHTQLTLWLDPGRIKTDLIPNEKLGLPIVNGNTYRIDVSKEFKDANGNPLNDNYGKTIFVRKRDSQIPDLINWTITRPETNTKNILTINFGESLDFALALETVQIINPDGKIVDGNFILSKKESILQFLPVAKWESGNYTISVDSKLEDLAGNNLNHLFDRDLNIKVKNGGDSKFKSIQFEIK